MVRMNLFQRLTRCWDQIHPYNAAQVMRLSIPCNLALAQQAWDSTLMDLGLGRAEVQGRQYRHYAGTAPVQLLPADADPEAFVADQLNLRFDPDESPFRAFMQPTAEGMLAGIIYHHWIADSVSIRLLMREWFFRMSGCGQPRRQPVPILGEETSSTPGGTGNTILELIRLTHRLKSVRRLPRAMCKDLSVGHSLLHLPDGTAQLLRESARRRGVKVTDLLLCSLAEICQRHLPPAPHHRPNLALGSIRDARPAARAGAPDDAFGALLAFGNILCPAATLSHRAVLLQHIAKQSAAQRLRQGTSASDLDMRLALLALSLIRRDRATEFVRKRMPFSAGLSNVDLSRSWVTQHPQVLTDFYRVSPAGPALPLVITPTTLGQRFNISLTWRKSVISETAAAAIATDLQESLSTWTTAALAYEPAA